MVTDRQITSNTEQSGAMAAGSLLLGLLFVWLVHGKTEGDSNRTAAMWLGILLAGTGIAGLLFLEETTVSLDTKSRRIQIERRRWWGPVSIELSFDEIESVRVAKIGNRSEGTPTFWLQLQPREGHTIATGRWSTNEAEMNRIAEQLASQLGCACHHGEGPFPVGSFHLLAATVGAIVLYALWFRVSVGPWCAAMWAGTAPPVIVLLSFGLLLGLLRRFVRVG